MRWKGQQARVEDLSLSLSLGYVSDGRHAGADGRKLSLFLLSVPFGAFGVFVIIVDY